MIDPGLLNYWVVIFLMMTGFYIVIGQRNLIKSIIGLNIFQTSVFLLYITMGKVERGTAPIIPPEVAEAMAHGDHHAGEPTSGEATTGEHGPSATIGQDASSTIGQASGATTGHAAGPIDGPDVGTVHDHDAITHAADASAELSYSNPLPSVLMLTAIVVGIATTALALALIVRIREDYGTIEEDEILAIDQQEQRLTESNGANGVSELNALTRSKRPVHRSVPGPGDGVLGDGVPGDGVADGGSPA